TTPSVIRTVSRVGTALFDVAVNPSTGLLWVPNTEARNLVRFEPKLRGPLVDTRVSIVNSVSGAVRTLNLNAPINYNITPASTTEIANSLAEPVSGVFDSARATYYVAALGSPNVR